MNPPPLSDSHERATTRIRDWILLNGSWICLKHNKLQFTSLILYLFLLLILNTFIITLVCNPFRRWWWGWRRKCKTFHPSTPTYLTTTTQQHIMLAKVFDLNVCDDAKLMMINVLMADDGDGTREKHTQTHTHTPHISLMNH